MAAPARHLDTQINFLRQLPEHPAGPILVPDPPPVEPGEREDVRRLREGLEIAVRTSIVRIIRRLRAVNPIVVIVMTGSPDMGAFKSVAKATGARAATRNARLSPAILR